MSFIRLENGRIVVIDTCDTSNTEINTEINLLTKNGELIEAVVATHPFHTLFFRQFYAKFPNCKYYGTPRHLEIIPDIPWAGSVNDESIRSIWNPEIEIRIPDGADFVNVSQDNHFISAFVFHKNSKVIHVDDTIMYLDNPSCILRCCAGLKPNSMMLHVSLYQHKALIPKANSAALFKAWVDKLMVDWDFDTIATAHTANKVGGAKEMLAETMKKAQKYFDEFATKHATK